MASFHTSKSILFFAFILFQSFVCYPQSDQAHLSSLDSRPDEDMLEVSGAGNHGKYFSGSSLNVNDISNMVGSPFFISTQIRGIVFFQNGKQYKDSALQFNWVKNELHFGRNDKWYYFTDSINSFVILDSSGKNTIATFRSGYPGFGSNTTRSFYEVVKDGQKFQLLRYWRVHSEEIYHYGAPYTKEYSKAPDWYVYDAGQRQLKFITMSLASLEKALPACSAIIKSLAEQNNIKKINESQMSNIIDSINHM